MQERPYIGVTGPTTRQEVGSILDSFENNGFNLQENGHQPMIGLLVSQRTLNGESISNRRFPDFSNIPSLLEATGDFTFNTIHYSSRELTDLSNQILGIFSGQIYEDQLSRGVQLNIPWPPIDELVRIKRSFPDLKIIMQLSNSALRGRTPRDVADLLSSYGSLPDYTLIDPSGGRGEVFQPEVIIPYFDAIKIRLPNLTIGLAGGFTGDNVAERCQEIVKLIGTNEFSIDAEGGLRDKVSDVFGDDLLSTKKTEYYLSEAAKIF